MSELTPEALEDIQGIILSGYQHLRYGSYLFLQIRDAAAGRAWLAKIIPAITTAKRWAVRPDGTKDKVASAVHVAFTHPGFKALGLSEEVLHSFSAEFIEGITGRASILGDTGDSAPEQWEVGGSRNAEVHVLVRLSAFDEDILHRQREEHRQLLQESGGGVIEVNVQEGVRPQNNKEPFGFRDGISNPIIEGTDGNPTPNQWVVRTGEFILGYINEYELYPPSPAVSVAHDPTHILPPFQDGALPQCRDFGRHGSYMVYRKLAQDVAGFWRFIAENAKGPDDSPDHHAMIWLASKCVGRWPSGAPLVLTPDKDDPQYSLENMFTYQATDKAGYACPWGAHIRRANIRDSKANNTPEASFKTANRHRIIRRATSFRAAHLFATEDLDNGKAPLEIKGDGQPRGIHFFAINANITNQFEFIQQTWCDSPNFNGMYDNRDPLIGDNDGSSHMTIPQVSVRRRLQNLPRFVTVRGGGYFFLPSITALRFLAQG